jgi:RNA polymerase sigma-32 factor
LVHCVVHRGSLFRIEQIHGAHRTSNGSRASAFFPCSRQDWLVDEHADQETTLAATEELGGRRKALASALSALNNRERRIFEARRLAEEPITLKELADEFGISRERVRQIGVCAFEKVQKSVKRRVAVMETPAPLPVH